MIKFLIVGYGVQGKKRAKLLRRKDYLVVDSFQEKVDFKKIQDVPKNFYDAVMICVPDNEKIKIIDFCIKNNKHFLVEKPFPLLSIKKMNNLKNSLKKKKLVGYVAYNHRFEPHFINMKKIISKQILGKIYSCKIFYGNGTAKLVKNSTWRDKGQGVVSDLGSHLLDTCKFWFKIKKINSLSIIKKKFENSSWDHAIINFDAKKIFFNFEISLCSWRNHLICDVVGEKGSAHIMSLCKWDKTDFIIRKRKFPSGKPFEIKKSIKIQDPTWLSELNHFKKLVRSKAKIDLQRDIWINEILSKLS